MTNYATPAHDTVRSVRIRLSGSSGKSAIMDVETHEHLASIGIKPPFYLNASARNGHSYVRVGMPSVAGKLAIVARLIAEAGLNEIVGYRNGDRLDLRRANLVVQRGKAKGQSPWLGKPTKAERVARKATPSAEAVLSKGINHPA